MFFHIFNVSIMKFKKFKIVKICLMIKIFCEEIFGLKFYFATIISVRSKLLSEKGRIRSRICRIRMRTREAKKHTDPMDSNPDPEYWFEPCYRQWNILAVSSTFFLSGTGARITRTTPTLAPPPPTSHPQHPSLSGLFSYRKISRRHGAFFSSMFRR
jgi:hypothetical protein